MPDSTMSVTLTAVASPARRLRLFYVGDAALARECLGRPGGSIDVLEALPDSGGAFHLAGGAVPDGPFDVLLIEHGHPGVDTLAILQHLAARNLHVPAVIVADWDEELAAAALRRGASDYLIKSKASFRALYFRLRRLISHAALLQDPSRLSDPHPGDDPVQDDRIARAEALRDEAEQRLSEAVAAIRQAREGRLADAVAAARELVQLESEYEARLRAAAESTRALEKRLADRDGALRDAEDRVAIDHASFEETARRQAELESSLRREVERRVTLETRLTYAAEALREAEQRRRADAAAFAGTLAHQQSELSARLIEIARARDAAERRSKDAMAATAQERQEHAADAAAAAERFEQREAELLSELTDAVSARGRLEQRLSGAAAALQCAEHRVLAEQHAAHQRIGEHRAEFQAQMAHQSLVREALHQQLEQAKGALQNAEIRRVSEEASVAAQIADLQARYDARLAQAAAAQLELQALLASAEARFQQAEERHASEMKDAETRLVQSQQAADVRFAQATKAIEIIENQLAESHAERERSSQDHAVKMAEAAELLAAHQKEAETWISEAGAFANAMEAELAEAVRVREQVEQQAALDLQAAAELRSQQHVSFEAQLAEEAARRDALAEQLQNVELTLGEERERHATDMRAAAAQLIESQEKADARMEQATAAIKVSESKRAEAVAALDRVVRQATAERQAASAESRRRQADFDAALNQEAAHRQTTENELAEARKNVQHLQSEGNRIHQALASAEEQITQLESGRQDDRAAFERTRLAIEADLAQQRADHDALRQLLEETRAGAWETVDRLSRDGAIERDRYEVLVAERDEQLRQQLARGEAADAAAAAALADVEHRLQVALEAQNRDRDAIKNLQNRLEALGKELETTRSQRESLRVAADLVPALERQLDTIRGENNRGFEETPVNRCRFTRNGVITDVNRALAGLLGYETREELQKVDFREAVFESADDLAWIIQRCLSSRAGQSMDTIWKRKDGARLSVRVLAVATSGDSIDLVAEDITHVQDLEERLRTAHRLEAVARYGSEVAETCRALLTHVKQEGQQWVAQMESEVARYQGELILDEVTRAAGFLGQLAAYGDEQRNVPEFADVNKVLRDLEPVLKRVAGDNIELVLPKGSAPLNLDVEPRPVERMLVNVAAYSRERMPLGGRLKIDIDAVTLDREFVAKYPNVRPGAHVLLTVNEVRSAARPEATVDTPSAGAASAVGIAENPGVDLGALQTLVSNCGGHLWMRAEPPGVMVLKIHLPRRVVERAETRTPAIHAPRSRWLKRAFGARH